MARIGAQLYYIQGLVATRWFIAFDRIPETTLPRQLPVDARSSGDLPKSFCWIDLNSAIYHEALRILH